MTDREELLIHLLTEIAKVADYWHDGESGHSLAAAMGGYRWSPRDARRAMESIATKARKAKGVIRGEEI